MMENIKEIEVLKQLDRLFQPSNTQDYMIKEGKNILKGYSMENALQFVQFVLSKNVSFMEPNNADSYISSNGWYMCENIEELYELFLKSLEK